MNSIVGETQSTHEFGSRLLDRFEDYNLQSNEELVITTNKGAPIGVSCAENYRKIVSRLLDKDKGRKVVRIYSALKHLRH